MTQAVVSDTFTADPARALPDALIADITARDAQPELPFDTVNVLNATRFAALRLRVAKGGFGAPSRIAHALLTARAGNCCFIYAPNETPTGQSIPKCKFQL